MGKWLERARRLAINADPRDNSANSDNSPSAERSTELSAANVTIVEPKTGEANGRDRSSGAGASVGAASAIKASACRDDSDNSDNRTSVGRATALLSPIVTNVRGASSSDWNAGDWRDLFDERAAIAEYEGGLSRAEAERLARLYCCLEWANRNPPPDPGGGRCVHCRQSLSDDVTTISTAAGTRHLHAACADAYAVERARAAKTALAVVGIVAPSDV